MFDGGRDQGGDWEKSVVCATPKSAGEGEQQNGMVALHKRRLGGREWRSKGERVKISLALV